MASAQQVTFGPFRLDVAQGTVWRADQESALRPRSFAVLRYLAEHPGRLVTKAELLQHVWNGAHVSDTVLRVCIREIRAALGDSATAPQYLATVGRQGYRLLVPEATSTPAATAVGPVVGRQAEVAALETWFWRAAEGQRQIVFLSGDAGSGKTTVLSMLLARLEARTAVRIGTGHCAEHYGEGEPYLPLLEALRQLGRGPQGAEIVTVLRRYAPMWLM
jgi:DNA-binding winged helix-turn-helix (wHTH) protein